MRSFLFRRVRFLLTVGRGELTSYIRTRREPNPLSLYSLLLSMMRDEMKETTLVASNDKKKSLYRPRLSCLIALPESMNKYINYGLHGI